MGFEVKIPDNLRRLAVLYDEKLKDRTAKALARALEEEAREISKRTQHGNDVEGAAFDGYKPSYKAFRKRKGRDFTRVTLNFTGAMLRGLRTKVQATRGYLEGTIFFLPSQRNKARWNNDTRQFFGLSQEQVIRIIKKVREALK
jgi:hypothetical protein